MGRKHTSGNRRIKVTRELYAMAQVAAQRAAYEGGDDRLALRVAGSRRISRRMLKALKAQAV